MVKFTIIIPTRERADTLYWTIQTCIAQEYENLTILISDNCSTDNTREIIEGFKDSRIQYIRPNERLSMSMHWDFALSHVHEGYVCIIGDDDGIAPNALHHVNKIILETGSDSVSSQDKAIYFWPGYLDENKKGLLQLCLNNTYRIASTPVSMRKSMKALRPVLLPPLYHGFVNIETMNRLPKSEGKLFIGSIPDIYSSVLLGIRLKKHVLSNYPFTIHGLSHHSIGSSFSMKHINPDAAEKFIQENKTMSHPKIIICSATTPIFVDCLLHAHDQIPSFPEPDMKRVIFHSLKEASKKTNIEAYLEIVNATKETARINQIEKEFEQIVQKFPFKTESEPVKLSPLGYMNNQETLYLQTLDMKAENVFDVFKIMKHILNKEPINILKSTPSEGIAGFMRRKLRSYLRRLSGKN